MIRLKLSVSLDNVHPKLYAALAVAAMVWAEWGSPDLWVTGGNETGHSTGPRGFHRLPDGTCQAADLRIWTLPEENRDKALKALADKLGPLYDVLMESNHVHLQYDPDRPGTNNG